MISIRPAYLAAAALVALLSQANAQGVPSQDGASAAPAMSVAQTRKSGQMADPSGPAGLPGFAELTDQECRDLGGAVHTAPQCKKTGTRCVIRLPGGVIKAPCINEVK